MYEFPYTCTIVHVPLLSMYDIMLFPWDQELRIGQWAGRLELQVGWFLYKYIHLVCSNTGGCLDASRTVLSLQSISLIV